MAEIKLTADRFQAEVLCSDRPVLIDFWADWCGPCKMLAPTIAEIADEYAGKVKVGKINVDEEPELAAAFRIISIPTVVLMRYGKVENLVVGYCPKERLTAMLG